MKRNRIFGFSVIARALFARSNLLKGLLRRPKGAPRNDPIRKVLTIIPYLALCLGFQLFFSSCISWTERDYELQKKAYEKERQQKELENQNSGVVRW